ncbi:MAG: hypothetical protein AAF572_00070 [Cyanobacteria bacterium P01_B01_bin.77]
MPLGYSSVSEQQVMETYAKLLELLQILTIEMSELIWNSFPAWSGSNMQKIPPKIVSLAAGSSYLFFFSP